MRDDDHNTPMGRDARDAARRAESAAILERVRQETDPQIGAGAARIAAGAAGHFAGRDADPNDRIEVWGTRIGRLAGLVGFVVLALVLGWQILS